MTRNSTNRSNKAALAVGLLVLLCGCKPAPKPWTPKPGTVEFKVVQIAEQAVAKAYPKYDRRQFPIRLYQKGEIWVFNYDLPDNMMGGTPTVEIDKKTLKVVDVYHTQ